MKLFSVSQLTLRDLHRRTILRCVVIQLVLIAIFAFLLSDTADLKGMEYRLFGFPLLGTVINIFYYRLQRDTRTDLAALRIELDTDSIRAKVNNKDIHIPRAEIQSIFHTEHGELIVTGNNSRYFIDIPTCLENFADLKQTLVQWHPIDPTIRPKPRFLR